MTADATSALEKTGAELDALAGQHFTDLDLERHRRAERAIQIGQSLFAAIEAVLKLADTWSRVDTRLSEMGREAAPIGDLRREMALSHAKIFEDCAAALREAISRELTGKEENDALS